MTKILITGFRHSGTTLLMQLIMHHPQVGGIENEEGYIEFPKPKEWVEMMASKRVPDLKKYDWGEKLPWGTRDNDFKARRAIGFSTKWLRYFGKSARVLHILRHPIGTASSGGKDGKPGEEALKFIESSLLRFIDFVNSDKRCATIVYENLVLEPHIYLPKIFKFLNLNDDPKITEKVILDTELKVKFGRINPERAYSYKGDGMDEEYDKYLERLKHRL